MREETYVPPIIHRELRTFILLLRGVSNNVNQMARHSNLIKRVDDAKGLFDHLRKLEQRVVDYTKGRLRSDQSEGKKT